MLNDGIEDSSEEGVKSRSQDSNNLVKSDLQNKTIITVDAARLVQDDGELTEFFEKTIGSLVAGEVTQAFSVHERRTIALLRQVKRYDKQVTELLKQAEEREHIIKQLLLDLELQRSNNSAILQDSKIALDSLKTHIQETKEDMRQSSNFITLISTFFITIIMGVLIAYNQHEIEDKVAKGISEIEIKILKGEYMLHSSRSGTDKTSTTHPSPTSKANQPSKKS